MMKRRNEKEKFQVSDERCRLFSSRLLDWNQVHNHREMPWKHESNPYYIWLSEIILQQTRVEQGWKYYMAFIETFPTIQELAAASEQQVFKLWEGLGYYSRCRNLIATAKKITADLKGVFPQTHEAILGLKGVGPYTAAAIASFAYNLPHAVLDGNVFRVLSRIHDVDLPVDTTEGKKQFAAIAQQQLPKEKAGIYNQAIMDFGATICKPVPLCVQCFFNDACLAFLQGKQASLPVKTKKLLVKERWFHYVILQYGSETMIHQRVEKDIWQELYEPLLIEGGRRLEKKEVLQQLASVYSVHLEEAEVISAAAKTTQKLSHQTIHFSFIHLQCAIRLEINGFFWVDRKEISHYAFPKTLQAFIAKNIL
jgi:A/G-specific adenine glycosylase